MTSSLAQLDALLAGDGLFGLEGFYLFPRYEDRASGTLVERIAGSRQLALCDEAVYDRARYAQFFGGLGDAHKCLHRIYYSRFCGSCNYLPPNRLDRFYRLGYNKGNNSHAGRLQMPDIKSAVKHIDSLKNNKQRNYAERVFAYYRDYGTPRQSAWPMYLGDQLSTSTERRIANAIRHFMVGDCDVKGRLHEKHA